MWPPCSLPSMLGMKTGFMVKCYGITGIFSRCWAPFSYRGRVVAGRAATAGRPYKWSRLEQRCDHST
jgi:hypothetical protein